MIDKGLQLLNKEGFDGFSLRKVARMCEVSHTAPYKHFKNKEDLISEISLEVISKFKASLDEVKKKYDDNPKTQIIEMGKQYVKFMVENPDYLKFLFLSDFNYTTVIDNNQFITPNKDSAFKIFEESAKAFLASNNSNTEDAYLDILTMWSIVHGISVLLANKSIEYTGDYMDLVDKMLKSEL